MTNNQHLIALDLDGTLLTDQKNISDHSLRVIKEAENDGHIVVIATGRSNHSSIHYYHELELNTPIVNFNGALTFHPRNPKWGKYHYPLPEETTMAVIDACYEIGVYNILVEDLTKTFLDQYDQEIINIFETVPDMSQQGVVVGKLNKELLQDATAILIMPAEDQVDALTNYLAKNHGDVIEFRNWGAPWNIFEVTKKGVHKAFGLKKIADYFQIPQERIIAFGDEDNDCEMIEYAGVGVAMQNAIPKLKNLANYITDTNENDGVATFLTEYLNIHVPAK